MQQSSVQNRKVASLTRRIGFALGMASVITMFTLGNSMAAEKWRTAKSPEYYNTKAYRERATNDVINSMVATCLLKNMVVVSTGTTTIRKTHRGKTFILSQTYLCGKSSNPSN